jgi:GTP-binding protein EngB required for normal cell division
MSYLTRDETIRIVQEFGKLAESIGKADIIKTAAPQLQRLALGVFRLVVVGEIKKGKTSFINALLGIKDFLPVSSDIATSTVYKIYYGPERKIKVFFQEIPEVPEGADAGNAVSHASPTPPLEISPEKIADYGTEDGNPENIKNVDFIAVEAPHPLLKTGLVIIDTPGLGGLFRKHADITWRYIPNADAIFFALDSVEAVMTRDETEFLEKLRRFTTRVFFVQTKIDAAEEEQWKAWAERNKSIIGETLGVSPGKMPYFPVSSQLKLSADRRHSPQHLQRSGFLPLLDFIHNRLLPAKESLISRDVLQLIAAQAVALRSDAAAQLGVVRAGASGKLDELKQGYEEAKGRLVKWEQKDWPRAMEKFNDQIKAFTSWAQGEFACRLDASPMGPAVSSIINQIRSDGSIDAKAIDSQVKEIQSSCIDYCTAAVFDIQEEANSKLREIIHNAFSAMSEEYQKIQIDPEIAHGPELLLASNLNVTSSWFSTIQRGFMGVGVGSALVGGAGYAAAYLTVMAFPLSAPVVGAALLVSWISPVAGSLLGGLFARREHKQQQKDQALAQLQQLLANIVQKSHQYGVRQFMDNLSGLCTRIRDLSREQMESNKRSLEDRALEIETAKKQTDEEAQRSMAEAETRLARIDAILTNIDRLCSDPADKTATIPIYPSTR